MVDGLDHLAMDDLRIGQGLGQVVDGRAGHPDVVQSGQPFLGLARGEDLVEDDQQRLAIGDAAGGGGKARILDQVGPLKLLRNPIRFSETPIETYAPPPAVGEQTDPVLRGLGYDSDTISQLRSRGVI